ncbi:MAG: hypothetical protein AAF492_19220, partial [Verrucomicrobiota bacterium]
GAELHAPASLEAGQPLQARFRLTNEEGNPVEVESNVRVRLFDAKQRGLVEIYRGLGPSGHLPPLTVPASSAGSIILAVNDTVTGFASAARISVKGAQAVATEAEPVTVYRGNRIHGWLKQSEEFAIVVDEGTLNLKDGVALKTRAEHAEQEREWAIALKGVLAKAGVRATVHGNASLVEGPLYAHPWTGSKAGYRTRHTVPQHRIDRPVIVIGSPRRNQYLNQMDRAYVSGRSLGPAHTGPGRAVIAWAPKAFSPQHDALIVAITDRAGLAAAAIELLGLVQADPGPDAYYTARERIRGAWLPTEVARHKNMMPTEPTATKDLITTQARRTQGTALTEKLGTAIFALDASPGGIAVGTKSWAKPTGLVSPDGKVIGFWGGGEEVTPRDVGVSADGRIVAAGYSLLGRSVGRDARGKVLWAHESGMAYKSNPFQWDSFKDSDRHLGVAPDHSLFIASAGTEGLIAYEADTGKPRWRVPGALDPGRPRGPNLPEIAFSPESQRVLVSSVTDDGVHPLRFQVKKFAVDPATGKTNKKESED